MPESSIKNWLYEIVPDQKLQDLIIKVIGVILACNVRLAPVLVLEPSESGATIKVTYFKLLEQILCDIHKKEDLNRLIIKRGVKNNE